MNDVLYLIFIPLYPIGIIMSTVYATEGVFRYEFKNKKVAYITAAAMAVLIGIVSDVFCVLMPDAVFAEDDLTIYAEDITKAIGTMMAFVVLMFLASGKVWKRVLAVFLSSEIIGCINHIFQALLILLSGARDWEDSDYNTITAIAYELLTMALVFMFLFLLARVRSKNDNTPMPLPVMCIATVLMLMVNSFVADDFTSPFIISSDVAKPVLLILVLLTVWLLFFLRVTRKERDGFKALNKINEELVDSQTKYFEASAKADSEIRAIRHDMKNNIQVLMLLLEQGEHVKMREYLEEMGENLTSADISAHTGNTIADSIIAEKTAKAEALGLSFECSGRITDIEISPVDMCKMLANLLDNAIEAASAPELSEIEDSQKVIKLVFKKTDNFFMISVTNPCIRAPQIKDGKIVTSKKDSKNHGFGIHNIETAAAVYGGELNVSCEEKQYGFLYRAEIVFPI